MKGTWKPEVDEEKLGGMEGSEFTLHKDRKEFTKQDLFNKKSTVKRHAMLTRWIQLRYTN